MIKVRELIPSSKEISLPIIIDCTEVFQYPNKKNTNILHQNAIRHPK